MCTLQTKGKISQLVLKHKKLTSNLQNAINISKTPSYPILTDGSHLSSSSSSWSEPLSAALATPAGGALPFLPFSALTRQDYLFQESSVAEPSHFSSAPAPDIFFPAPSPGIFFSAPAPDIFFSAPAPPIKARLRPAPATKNRFWKSKFWFKKKLQ